MTVTAIATTTASSSSSVSFTIDGTYDEILFTYAGVKGTVDECPLGFQVNTSNGTRDRPVQSVFNREWHYVADYSAGGPTYQTSWDRLYTDENWVPLYVGGDTHESYTSGSGELRIFRPSDTTHWKYFQIKSTAMKAHLSAFQRYLTVNRSAGYIRDTAALTYIRFTMITYDGTAYQGNINYGTFSMYGVS